MFAFTRRRFLLLLPACGMLAGCDSGNPPVDNQKLKDALSSLDSAIGGLESNVEDFNTDNWREVVPEVETAATGVRGAFDNLKQAFGANAGQAVS